MPRQPWWPPSSHGHHGAPLLAPPHTTICQHSGRLFSASAPGVGHHGGRCRPFRSRRTDGRCGLVVGCVLRRNMWGFIPCDRRYPSDEVTMSILVGIGAPGAAASTPNSLFCCILRAGTSMGNDVWWGRRQNRRN